MKRSASPSANAARANGRCLCWALDANRPATKLRRSLVFPTLGGAAMSWVWKSVAFAGVISSFVGASQVSAEDSSACEVHVWQSKLYISESPAPYGALLQAFHDARYPSNSVEGQMEYEFRSESLGDLIGAVPWSNYLGRPVKVIVEPSVVDKAHLKGIKA